MHAFFQSFIYAFRGIIDALRDERSMKIHFAAIIATSASAFYFHFNYMEWCIIVLCFALVVSLEMMNSAIENTVDLYTNEKMELARKAKDIAAGAVLIASIFSVIIYFAILYHHFN
ncbi:MAG: diacylglycerol kinase family protein [Bacteroidetes bacterium]|nr:diacylglycerol kinase family protein [Bacteroidota bacterium]